MSPVVVLMGLLVLAYFGSMLVGGRAIRGFGLPSGTEFVLLGIFVGPELLGFVTRSGLASFEPLIAFGLTWLALTIGLHYGFVGDRRISKKRLFAGLGLATLTLAITGAVVGAVAFVATPLRGNQLAVLALGCASVSTETTRHAVRWVTERYGADGPLSQLVADLSEADDAVPIGALAILAVLLPQTDAVALPLPGWVLVPTTIAAGGIMGATCAALVDIEPRTSQRWGIVLGCLLLAGGASLRLGLSAMTTGFVMGLVVSALASSGAVVSRMVATSERAVMLPSLFLAGAYVSRPASAQLAVVVGAAFAARVAAKLLMARLLTMGEGSERAPRVSLGLGLLPAGVLTMSIGLACAFRFPGVVGDTILTLAALNAALGEVVGPAMLRRAMKLAGEIAGNAAATPIPAPSRVRHAQAKARGSRGSRGSLSGASRRSDSHDLGGRA